MDEKTQKNVEKSKIVNKVTLSDEVPCRDRTTEQ